MDTFPCLSATRWTEIYECAVHVGQRYLALSASQSGQASSILVSAEWQIGCHKTRPDCSVLFPAAELSGQGRHGNKNPCRYKQCVWDTVTRDTLQDGLLYMSAAVLHRSDSFIC